MGNLDGRSVGDAVVRAVLAAPQPNEMLVADEGRVAAVRMERPDAQRRRFGRLHLPVELGVDRVVHGLVPQDWSKRFLPRLTGGAETQHSVWEGPVRSQEETSA